VYLADLEDIVGDKLYQKKCGNCEGVLGMEAPSGVQGKGSGGHSPPEAEALSFLTV